ncbi:hypothetical protein HMI54_001662 [Coelomomyces lativittatus]|nr:hypothetical protein HMI54_001662 [Coelomomyces lativittatus]
MFMHSNSITLSSAQFIGGFNSLYYTPNSNSNSNSNFNGVDTFDYMVLDGLATYATATIAIRVTPVNDPLQLLKLFLDDGQDSSSWATITISIDDDDVAAAERNDDPVPAHSLALPIFNMKEKPHGQLL